MELTVNELRDLVLALSQSDIAELTLKSSTFELTLRKPTALAVAPILGAPVVEGAASAAPVQAAPVVASPSTPGATPSTAPVAEPVVPPGKNSELVTISSPMVGTFYRSPAPDEPPFVEVGERINPGQPVCIIEAMKLMNELEAEMTGEIVEILVNNAEPVEFGQALMLVRPL